jgi:serine/threonine-protein kinase
LDPLDRPDSELGDPATFVPTAPALGASPAPRSSRDASAPALATPPPHALHHAVLVVALAAVVFVAHHAAVFVFAAEPPASTLIHTVPRPASDAGALPWLTSALSSLRAQYVRPLVESVIFTVGAVFLARRRPADPMLQLVMLVALLMGVNSGTVATLTTVPAHAPALPWRVLAVVLYTLAPIGSFAVLAVYPSGKPVPRGALAFGAIGALPFVGLAAVMFVEHRFSTPLVLVGMAFVAVALLFQRHRYRRHATIRQRHQILWMAYGAGLFVVLEAATLAVFPLLVDPARPSFPFLHILEEACLFAANIVPITAMAFSAAEYRLWEVDRLIGRSLVYAVLTALLALGSAAAFFAVRLAALALFGAGDLVGAAVAALFVALAFEPSRRAVRRWIDRRFWGIGVDYEALARRATEVAALPVEGESFASFASLTLLGRGGMGAVYKASHPELGAAVVLKVMSAEVARDPEMRGHFRLEAEILEQMDHPNIVPFLARGENYLAMTWVDGRDLAARIAEGPIPLAEALPVLRDVASALDALHRKQIVHRDVKPSNVLVAEGRAMLLDFGVAKRLDDATTHPDEPVGTLAYMAPEQLQLGAVDGRADLYGLAVTAYEMLAGRRPFLELEREPLGLAVAQLHHPPPDPRTYVELPELVVGALLVGLAKRPQDRPRDCATFVAGLADAATG